MESTDVMASRRATSWRHISTRTHTQCRKSSICLSQTQTLFLAYRVDDCGCDRLIAFELPTAQMITNRFRMMPRTLAFSEIASPCCWDPRCDRRRTSQYEELTTFGFTSAREYIFEKSVPTTNARDDAPPCARADVRALTKRACAYVCE